MCHPRQPCLTDKVHRRSDLCLVAGQQGTSGTARSSSMSTLCRRRTSAGRPTTVPARRRTADMSSGLRSPRSADHRPCTRRRTPSTSRPRTPRKQCDRRSVPRLHRMPGMSGSCPRRCSGPHTPRTARSSSALCHCSSHNQCDHHLGLVQQGRRCTAFVTPAQLEAPCTPDTGLQTTKTVLPRILRTECAAHSAPRQGCIADSPFLRRLCCLCRRLRTVPRTPHKSRLSSSTKTQRRLCTLIVPHLAQILGCIQHKHHQSLPYQLHKPGNQSGHRSASSRQRKQCS